MTPRIRLEQWGYRIAMASVAVVALASLSWPFGWDQGIFAWVGDVITRGGLPYRDAWDIKGPMPYYVFALAQRVFGPHAWSIRILDILFVTFGAWAVCRTSGRFAGQTAARWAAVGLVMWYASGTYWHTAQADGWVAFLMAAATMPLLLGASQANRRALCTATACVGACALAKPVFGAFVFVPLVHLFVHRKTTERLWTTVGACALTGAAPLVLVAGWFAFRGGLGDLVDVSILYAANVYSGDAAVGSPAGDLIAYVLDFKVLVTVLPVAAYGLAALRKAQRSAAIVLGTWTAVALGLVVLQNRFFEYHWLPTYPPVTILAAIGFSNALGRGLGKLGQPAFPTNSRLQAVDAVWLLVVFLHAFLHPAYEVARWVGWVAGATESGPYFDGFGIAGAERRAAHHIRLNSSPDDGVVVWGWNSGVLFLSGRMSPTRFGFSMPLLLGDEGPPRQDYRREFMNDIERTLPLYVVEGPQAGQLLGGQFGLADFPEFHALVRSRYVEEITFGELTLHRLELKAEGSN